MGKLAELSDKGLLEKFKTCEDEYYAFKTAGDKTSMQKMVWKIIAVKKEMTKRGLDDLALGKTKVLFDDPTLGKTKYYAQINHPAKSLSLYDFIQGPKPLNVVQFWSSKEHSFKAATYAYDKSIVITCATATEWLCCSKEAISLLIASGVISEPYPEYLLLANVAHVKNLDAFEQASRFGSFGKKAGLEYWDGQDWKKMPSMLTDDKQGANIVSGGKEE